MCEYGTVTVESEAEIWTITCEDGGTYKVSRFITQVNLLLLHRLSLFKIHHDILGVRFFFRVGLAGAIGLEEFLDAAVAHDDHVATFLYHAVFGLNFFQQVRDLGGQVRHCDVGKELGFEE